jgi:hypothetical protein
VVCVDIRIFVRIVDAIEVVFEPVLTVSVVWVGWWVGCQVLFVRLCIDC